MPEPGQYGRRMRARRTSVLWCSHPAKPGEDIFKPPGQQGWICRDCALRLVKDEIAAHEAQAGRRSG